MRFEILLFAFIFLGVSPCTGDQNVLSGALTARNSDKPGLANKKKAFFPGSIKSYFRMPLVKSAWQAHCKNRKYQIVKQMPSMTTSVTCYTDCVMTRFLQAKKPRPKTSVAGTAMPNSGHDRAQRGQNPGITQNHAVARFWRHIFAWVVKSANSTSLPCLILLQIVQMPAI